MSPYKLRAYHNPENVDESKVPAGWRFRYADEMSAPAETACRAWLAWRFDKHADYFGKFQPLTYIVPVT